MWFLHKHVCIHSKVKGKNRAQTFGGCSQNWHMVMIVVDILYRSSNFQYISAKSSIKSTFLKKKLRGWGPGVVGFIILFCFIVFSFFFWVGRAGEGGV